MLRTVNKLAVVGGGTAGFVAALILKTKFPNMHIDVIRSSKIGIVGVGEGSTEHWTNFTDFVGLDYTTVVKECDATFKSGIMFKDWGKKDYLQSIGYGFNLKHQRYPYIYAHLISQGVDPKDLVSEHAWDSKVNTWFIGQEERKPVVQFHFNTNKLNEFLTKESINRGINVIDDEILDITFNQQGEIDTLLGQRQQYDYDFYIDSTGFSKFLISKLGAKWRSHGQYLKMKSAIVFPTEPDEDIPMWTLSRAMDAGWLFRIPVWGRYGNGYIFDSDYITADQAKQEAEAYLGREIEIGKQINFDPGALDKCWIKNCCAIGLSASFVEPLEASSIGTSIQQAFLLAEKLTNYNDAVIKKYNESIESIIDNIRDFLVLHYITDKESSQFWKDLKTSQIPDSLADKLDMWRHKLPTAEDFNKESDFILFSEFHHILVLYGLGLIDHNSIKNEYMNYVHPDKQLEAQRIIDTEIKIRCQTIPHKTMLEVLRNIRNENY